MPKMVVTHPVVDIELVAAGDNPARLRSEGASVTLEDFDAWLHTVSVTNNLGVGGADRSSSTVVTTGSHATPSLCSNSCLRTHDSTAVVTKGRMFRLLKGGAARYS
jgi:hypothetical protein